MRSRLPDHVSIGHVHVGVLVCVPHVALEGPFRGGRLSLAGNEEREEEPDDATNDRAPILDLVVPVVEFLDIPLFGNEGVGEGSRPRVSAEALSEASERGCLRRTPDPWGACRYP